MDDVLCDYSIAHTSALRDNPSNEFPQSEEGFFLRLDPITGAIDSVNELRDLHEVFVLTAPSTRNPHCYTEKRIWIEQHFDYAFTKKLILSPDKSLLIGDFLIDDHVSGRGQERFNGELIQFGSPKYPNWDAVLTFLKNRENFS